MAGGPLTSIPGHAEVVRHLRSLKTADQTWDEFLTEMAEDYVPPGWYAETERRRIEGPDVTETAVFARSRELATHGR
jgi:hypothetical protein